MGDLDIFVLVLARPPRGSISDNLLQGRLQIRRLRRAQPDKPRLGSRVEPLAELLKQEVLGGDIGTSDDEACRDFTAENQVSTRVLPELSQGGRGQPEPTCLPRQLAARRR